MESPGTLAARTRAPTKELMARLGHASARASLIYQHASEDRDRRIAERLDEWSWKPASTVWCPLRPILHRRDLARIWHGDGVICVATDPCTHTHQGFVVVGTGVDP